MWKRKAGRLTDLSGSCKLVAIEVAFQGVQRRGFWPWIWGFDLEGAELKKWTDQLLSKTGAGKEVIMRRRHWFRWKVKIGPKNGVVSHGFASKDHWSNLYEFILHISTYPCTFELSFLEFQLQVSLADLDTSHCRSSVFYRQAKCWYLLWQALWAVGRWRGPWPWLSFFWSLVGFFTIQCHRILMNFDTQPAGWPWGLEKDWWGGGVAKVTPRPFTGYSSLFPLRGHLFWVYRYTYTIPHFWAKPCFVTYLSTCTTWWLVGDGLTLLAITKE